MFLEQGRRGEPRPCKQMTVALSADGQGRRCGGGGMGRGEGRRAQEIGSPVRVHVGRMETLTSFCT